MSDFLHRHEDGLVFALVCILVVISIAAFIQWLIGLNDSLSVETIKAFVKNCIAITELAAEKCEVLYTMAHS